MSFSPCTEAKRYAIRHAVGKFAGLASKHLDHYLILDAMAGARCLDDTSTARTVVRAAVRFGHEAILADINDEHRLNMLTVAGGHAQVMIADHIDSTQRALDLINAHQHSGALLVYDPFARLERVSSIAARVGSRRYVDMIFSVPASTYKRTGGSIREIRDAFPRHNWLVSKPVYRWQWTVMIGTMASCGAMSSLEQFGFYSATSSTGQRICELIDKTAGEIHEDLRDVRGIPHPSQLSLFGG